MTYKNEVEFLGRKLEATGELTPQDPLKSYAWKSTSEPFPMTSSTTLESAEGGTLVIETIQAEPGASFKLAGTLLIKEIQGQTQKDLKKLEEFLEK